MQKHPEGYWKNQYQTQKEYHKKWYRENKERVITNGRLNREKNKERYSLIAKARRIRNRKHINIVRNERSKRIRDELVKLLGGRCILCNSTENLEIDHICGGGCIERRYRFSDVRSMRYYYLNHPEEAKEKLQILCRIHNHKKQAENGETRHKKFVV